MKASLLLSTFACLAILLGCATATRPLPEELRQVRNHCHMRATNRCLNLWDCTDYQLRRCIAEFGWVRASGRWTRVRTSADLQHEINAFLAQLKLREQQR